MRTFLRRNRFAAALTALLLVLAGSVFFIFAPWIQREIGAFQEFRSRARFSQDAAILKATNLELGRNLDLLDRQIARLSAMDPALRGVEIVENVRRTAMENKIALTGIESKMSNGKSGIIEYQIKAEAQGAYNQVGSWVGQCLRQHPHAKIENLVIRRNDIESGPNKVQAAFVFCFPNEASP